MYQEQITVILQKEHWYDMYQEQITEMLQRERSIRYALGTKLRILFMKGELCSVSQRLPYYTP